MKTTVLSCSRTSPPDSAEMRACLCRGGERQARAADGRLHARVPDGEGLRRQHPPPRRRPLHRPRRRLHHLQRHQDRPRPAAQRLPHRRLPGALPSLGSAPASVAHTVCRGAGSVRGVGCHRVVSPDPQTRMVSFNQSGRLLWPGDVMPDESGVGFHSVADSGALGWWNPRSIDTACCSSVGLPRSVCRAAVSKANLNTRQHQM